MVELRTILLVEGNPSDVEITLEAMVKNNLANQIIVVKDGIDALDYLRHEGKYKLCKAGNPCVILLDIKMPRMDGIEVLRNIRSDAALKRIPVVMLISSHAEKDLIKTFELEVNAYLVKPISSQQFIEAVKKIGSFLAVTNFGSYKRITV